MPLPPSDTPTAIAADAARSPAWRDDARRAAALDAIAAALCSHEGDIITIASEESGLTRDELAPEFARMWRTLALFAGELRRGAWRGHTHDAACANAADAIGPNHDVHQIRIALPGTVVVFGASNFPLAYGVLGGDTASALAAGCGVVVKEHPAHPRTGMLLWSIAREALNAMGISPDILGLVHDDGSDSASIARDLINGPGVVGVGFTGSRRVGESIAAFGAARTPPVPVFAEMGSLNPIVILPRAWERRGPAIAAHIADSLLMRHGQQCTAPGLMLLPSREAAEAAFDVLAARAAAAPARRMLSTAVTSTYTRRVEEVRALGLITRCTPWPRKSAGLITAPCIMLADGERLSSHPTAWEEIFGPAMLVSWYDDSLRALLPLHGTLTATLHAELDDIDAPAVLDTLIQHAGRVIVNGVPTGVRVCASTVHAGPWPSTNRPEATAVGPHAMLRWTRPVTLQNFPARWLPPQVTA